MGGKKGYKGKRWGGRKGDVWRKEGTQVYEIGRKERRHGEEGKVLKVEERKEGKETYGRSNGNYNGEKREEMLGGKKGHECRREEGRKGDVRRNERRQRGVKGEEELQWEAGKTSNQMFPLSGG